MRFLKQMHSSVREEILVIGLQPTLKGSCQLSNECQYETAS